MAIEKVFAIRATPEAIWDALWADLGEGESGSYVLEGSTWPSRLELQVVLGGIRCRLVYGIEWQDDHSIVTAVLTPTSARYPLYYALTFGHVRRNYQVLLAAGLANLKEAVEAPAEPPPGATPGAG
jgi:hypothetical protein